MSFDKSLELVQNYLRAKRDQNYLDLKGMLVSDVKINTPVGVVNGETSFFESLSDQSTSLRGFDIKKVFSDGDDVCVIYDATLESLNEKVLVTEWLKLKGGKINAVDISFGAKSVLDRMAMI